MAENATQRKLTAILSADVKGYSKLMGDDDESTVNTITAYRQIISELIQRHQGRVVDTPGDNILAEFGSALNAVNGAIAIQRTLALENGKLPDSRRMEFRIGINLGDILHKDDCIYGDGVNVAARIESLADPGGICISRGVFDQVKRKVHQGFEYLGEHTVKNIPEPIRIYRLLLAPEHEGKVIGEPTGKSTNFKKYYPLTVALVLICGMVGWWFFHSKAPEIEPASKENMEYPLPDKPSIAVLPFDNMSGDPDQEYFCDGLTEEIITALSKVPKVFVIARNSVFTYKGKPVKVKQVAEDLGIRYVLEGSVRKGGEKVRITAQLIDAISGHHLWAERYDRDLNDIFAVQDELTKKIITAMQVELTSGEQARVDSRGTENLQAYLKFLQAREAGNKLNIEANALGRQLAEEAIELDPQYAMAYRILAATYRMDVLLGISKSPKESYARCIDLLNKAIEMDDTYAEAYGALGFTLSLMGQHENAVATAEKAVALDPNSANSYAMLGHTLRFADRPKEAIHAYNKAIRLNPIPPTFYQFGLGLSYSLDGQHEKGIHWCEKAVKQNPDDFFARLMLTAAYSMAGQDEKARAEAAESLRINPKYTLAKAEKRAKIRYKDRWFAALRKAGIPENPPLALPDKPSIAVLPFENMSGDPNQQFLGYGITEQIITSLSKSPYILVIARQSSFAFREKQMTVQSIAKELGVQYILEGSIQRFGDHLRISAQLIDATSGHHRWAESYDRKLEDIFKLQDEITMQIIAELQGEIANTDLGRESSIMTNSLKAYESYLKGHTKLYERSIGNTLEARQLANEAIQYDRNYGAAYRLLAKTYIDEIYLHGAKNRNENIQKADELIQKSIECSGYDYLTHEILSQINLLKKQYDIAIHEGKKAVELNPNSAQSNFTYGMVLSLSERYKEAIPVLEKAILLNPIKPVNYLNQLAMAYLHTEQYGKAIPLWNQALKHDPDYYYAHLNLCAAYQITGELEKARQSAEELIRIRPDFRVSILEKRFVSKNEESKKRILRALREAGLPE